MGVRARLRAVCVVANPRNSQAIAVVCASQPIPNRIPHTFIRDHEHVLKKELLPLDFMGFQMDCYLKPLKHQR